MKRILQSLAGGVLIPIAWLVFASLVASVLEVRPADKLAAALVYPVAFPLEVLGPYYPASDSPAPRDHLIRNLLDLSAILMVVLLYFVLTYVVLRWRESRKLKSSGMR